MAKSHENQDSWRYQLLMRNQFRLGKVWLFLQGISGKKDTTVFKLNHGRQFGLQPTSRLVVVAFGLTLHFNFKISFTIHTGQPSFTPGTLKLCSTGKICKKKKKTARRYDFCRNKRLVSMFMSVTRLGDRKWYDFLVVQWIPKVRTERSENRGFLVPREVTRSTLHG